MSWPESNFGYPEDLPKGLIPIPEVIYLKPFRICPRRICDFRSDCLGSKPKRLTVFVCHYADLIRSIGFAKFAKREEKR